MTKGHGTSGNTKKEGKMTEFNFTLSLEDGLGKYVTKWISVVDNEVIAEGHTAKEVYEKARELRPGKSPFIMKVPIDQVMLL